MSGSSLMAIIGVLLVITGIALIGIQVAESGGKQISDHSWKIVGAEMGSTKFQMETSFPGISIIALGVIVLIVGAFTGRGH
jgi:hypothetical protein